jgi:hypothetical protein
MKLTNKSLTTAVNKAFRRMKKDELAAAMTSAGFVYFPGSKRGKRHGVQVFVKVCRYSDELLKKVPLSGGLFCELPQ